MSGVHLSLADAAETRSGTLQKQRKSIRQTKVKEITSAEHLHEKNSSARLLNV
jgi:hypothetical protein